MGYFGSLPSPSESALLDVLFVLAPWGPGSPATLASHPVPGLSPDPVHATACVDGALEDLQDWLGDFVKDRDPWSREQKDEFLDLLDGLRKEAKEDEEGRVEAFLLLLEISTLDRPNFLPGLGHLEEASTRELHALAIREARRWIESEYVTTDWLCTTVLGRAAEHPPERRASAVEVLAGRNEPETLPAIFTCARSPERPLRDAAMGTLAGWPNERVHNFMASQLDRWRRDRSWLESSTLREHFEHAYLAPTSSVRRRLQTTVREGVVAEDWREASALLEVAEVLDDRVAVPALLDGLEAWAARRGTDFGSRRMEGDLVAELRRRSGRIIGNHPERWRTWWERESSGVESAGSAPLEAPRTSAGFFGLRPETDRLLFVIDRSGSMETRFGTGKDTRHDEAIRQMLLLLRSLGEDTRFGIVVFSGGTHLWRRELSPATDSNLENARRWLHSHPPKGGTNLRPGIERALRIGGDGKPDLERLEADTVMVLCDGATAEGRTWVQPFLGRILDATRIRFHGVQIGGAGDGTLQALAEGTGGEFVQVRH